MFGGAGLYREGMMFGLIADDVAYLKVDDSNRADFVKAGSAPFHPYPELAKTTVMSYYEIPPEVLENREELCRWAQRALQIQVDKNSLRQPTPGHFVPGGKLKPASRSVGSTRPSKTSAFLPGRFPRGR
jgi:DNA transformation protein